MRNILIILFLLLVNIACSKTEKVHEQKDHIGPKVETYYTCSMHPQIRENKPGKCPICGMGLTKVVDEGIPDDKTQMSETKVKENYYCESDPQVTSEVPGECPLDGTAMLKRTQTNKTVAKVYLRKAQIEHFKANLFEVTTMRMQKKIRLLGTVLKSEDRESNIPARVPGRVEEVFVLSTGSLVKAGEAVLKLYAPKLLSGGDEYLIARKNYLKNIKNKNFKDLYEQSVQRMKLWGIQDKQLELWAKEDKIPREITIYSPVTGIVERKNAVVGKYFNEGQSFFDLVDLSSLWIEMDVYEYDTGLVTNGQEVELEFSAYPGELWKGKIDFINPVLDQKTRTLKMRTTLQNKEGKLKPGMVGTASVNLELAGSPLVIPRSAVIDTGKRKVVWVDIGNDVYQGQSILTGFESEGYVEVREGLSAGDRVVIDGNFLLDAQAQLFGGYDDTQTH